MQREAVRLEEGRRINVNCGITALIPIKDTSTQTVEVVKNRTFKVDTGSQITCQKGYVSIIFR